MRLVHVSLISLAFVAVPLAAQEPAAQATEEEPQEVLEPLPIIVMDSVEDEKMVIVGSRIPRKPLNPNGGVASNTPRHGLVPGSGMDPSSNIVRKKTVRSCRAAVDGISKGTACLLLRAREAMAAEDWLLVRGLLVPLARNAEAPVEERAAAAGYLFEASGLSASKAARVEALELLLGTGSLSAQEASRVHRNLSTMARQRGDAEQARDHLQKATKLDPTADQALANLAILQREAGLSAARSTMQQAIAARESKGAQVPAAWRDFVTAS